MRKHVWISVIAISIAVAAGAFVLYGKIRTGDQPDRGLKIDGFGSVQAVVPTDHSYAQGLLTPTPGQTVKTFELTAKESMMELGNGFALPVWTFNGTVPGPEIRVEQGDFVRVTLTNEMEAPVTIHWHGYPVISAMDGIPGYQQDAVRKGERFTYEFNASIPGTYWYHSHQDSSYQVDRGLYGVLIVDPKEGIRADREFTLVLDEWMENPDGDTGHGMHGMGGGMGQGMMGNMDVMEEAMMASLYNIYTVNGKSGSGITPLQAEFGDLVRLRLINAGYQTRSIHLPGQAFSVVAVDGQSVMNAALIRDRLIEVAPGERYDIEFTVDSQDNFVIDAHDQGPYSDQLKVPFKVTGSDAVFRKEAAALYPTFDYMGYGTDNTKRFTLDTAYDAQFTLALNTRMGKDGLEYTINGQPYAELTSLKIKTGDLVKVTFENTGRVNHPMHIHGHFFTILEKNGLPASGAEIQKDTLLVKPGEKYVVAFNADNPGDWVIHCHELHHAAAGMMIGIQYTDFKSNFTPNPENTFNIPE